MKNDNTRELVELSLYAALIIVTVQLFVFLLDHNLSIWEMLWL